MPASSLRRRPTPRPSASTRSIAVGPTWNDASATGGNRSRDLGAVVLADRRQWHPDHSAVTTVDDRCRGRTSMAAVDRSIHGADRVAAGDSWRGDRALNPCRVANPRAPERTADGDAAGDGDHDQLLVVPPQSGGGADGRRDRGRQARLRSATRQPSRVRGTGTSSSRAATTSTVWAPRELGLRCQSQCGGRTRRSPRPARRRVSRSRARRWRPTRGRCASARSCRGSTRRAAGRGGRGSPLASRTM